MPQEFAFVESSDTIEEKRKARQLVRAHAARHTRRTQVPKLDRNRTSKQWPPGLADRSIVFRLQPVEYGNPVVHGASTSREVRSNAEHLPLLVSPSVQKFDPFNSLSLTTDRNDDLLLLEYIHTAMPVKIALNSKPLWFGLAMGNPTFLHGILYCSAGYISMALGKRDLPATLQRKGTIIRLVTKRLTRKSGSVNQDVIGAVACLAMYELICGEEDALKVHLNALEKMVSMSGGLHHFDKLIRKLLLWIGLYRYYLADSHLSHQSSAHISISELQTRSQDVNEQAIDVLAQCKGLKLQASLVPPEVQADFLLIPCFASSQHYLQLSLTDDERVQIASKVYWIECNLIQVCNDYSRTQPWLFLLYVKPCMYAALLYSSSVLREIHQASFAVQLLQIRLRESFVPSSFQSLPDPFSDLLLWALFVGGLHAIEPETKSWYANHLTSVCQALDYKTWEQVENSFMTNLWLPNPSNSTCQGLWKDVARQLQSRKKCHPSEDSHF